MAQIHAQQWIQLFFVRVGAAQIATAPRAPSPAGIAVACYEAVAWAKNPRECSVRAEMGDNPADRSWTEYDDAGRESGTHIHAQARYRHEAW